MLRKYRIKTSGAGAFLDWLVARTFLKFQLSQSWQGVTVMWEDVGLGHSRQRELKVQRLRKKLGTGLSYLLTYCALNCCCRLRSRLASCTTLPNMSSLNTFVLWVPSSNIKCPLSLSVLDHTIPCSTFSSQSSTETLWSLPRPWEKRLFLFISPIPFPSSLHPHFHMCQGTLISQSENFRAEVPYII